MLLNDNDYPLLWQRKLDEITVEGINGVGNGNSLLLVDSQ